MNNTIFLQKMHDKNVTAYRMSKDTGIPYTNINQLVRGKTDINRCDCAMVCIIASYLGCHAEELINREEI